MRRLIDNIKYEPIYFQELKHPPLLYFVVVPTCGPSLELLFPQGIALDPICMETGSYTTTSQANFGFFTSLSKR